MNPPDQSGQPPAPRSLANLDAVELDSDHQALFDLALATNGGPLCWRQRKEREARDLIALAQVSRRYRIEWLDLLDTLRVIITMSVPVPCLPDPAAPLQIEERAHIGIAYPQAALRGAPSGTSLVEIIAPRGIWLPNVNHSTHGPQNLCLGLLPARVRTREILYMIYGALTLQTIQMDALNPVGVFSREAAEWWQQPANLKRIPLTREPFLANPEVKP